MLQTETPEVPGRMPLVTPPPAPTPVTPTPSFYLNQQQLQMLQVLQQNAANLNPQQQVKFLSNFMIVITSMEIILYFFICGHFYMFNSMTPYICVLQVSKFVKENYVIRPSFVNIIFLS